MGIEEISILKLYIKLYKLMFPLAGRELPSDLRFKSVCAGVKSSFF